ncbi:hypothetical protein CTheo_3653 [Ceratobasidium theobromae]|uniref:Uncharacterized protein n=1 Tax=Ceratobasidium theobromae TaxID=1582974 RepID=A0A5N5QMC2_9AGAM|nr:hypothetical protein CTheo_3653 [Ceratobasidium theobromae]
MDALDLDHSYCAHCETYIWPEKRQVEVKVPGKLKSKSGTIRGNRPRPAPLEEITKTRTVISLDRAPLYCSEKCRQNDLETGSANGRRIMEHFQPCPMSALPSPISPISPAQHNMDYFGRIGHGLPWTRRPSTTSTRSTTSLSSLELLEEHRQWSRTLLAESAERLSRSSSRAAISAEQTTLPKPKSKPEPEPKPADVPPVPFTHRRWKEGSKDMHASTRSVDVDVAALYDQYPMSQRVRSMSSLGSSLGMRRGSMSASTVSDTASIRTTSSRGSTRRKGGLCPEATRGLLVPAVMIRSTHSSDDGDSDGYLVRRNRTITQRTHGYSKSVSNIHPAPDAPEKSIQELISEARGPEYANRQGSRPVSSLGDTSHAGPLYHVTHTPPGPTRRHVVQEVNVDGKTELRILEEKHWEEPQK